MLCNSFEYNQQNKMSFPLFTMNLKAFMSSFIAPVIPNCIEHFEIIFSGFVYYL